MNRIKDTLLVILALSVIGFAISHYHTAGVIAESVTQQVHVLNSKTEPVPVVQVSKWEYRIDSCNGDKPDCVDFIGAGLQGWELVSVVKASQVDGYRAWNLVFKRPK